MGIFEKLKKYVAAQPLGHLAVHVDTELEPSEVAKLKTILKNIEELK